ncbi:MAG: helix-turn-helix domain-containing protein [Candidatus Hermodarchaeota archaeon]
MESISEQLKDMVEEKKVFKSGKLFKCILGLNVIESNVFSYLLKHDNVTTMELAGVFNKDRSSIQRALIQLNELGIIEKRSMSLKEYLSEEETNKRGYLYVYGAKDLIFIKEQLRDLLDRWYNSMSGYIDNLDSVFDCYENQGELC